jgi:hypothetical protein
MKLPYREGTWFAVPLHNGCFAAGLVARATNRGRSILCYFFGPYQAIPPLNELSSLSARDSLLAVMVGDLALMEGKWPVIGRMPSWKRGEWMMPLFIRREPISEKVWLVHRSDSDPSKVVREELLADPPPDNLRHDSLYGSGAAEKILAKLLC